MIGKPCEGELHAQFEVAGCFCSLEYTAVTM